MKTLLKQKTTEVKRELKKSILSAVVAAFGFLIALSWRDVITEYVDKISSLSPVQGKLISAVIITFICVLGIIIMTRFFSEK